MRTLGKLALVLAGLLLLLYPFVLMADVMGLAAIKPGTPWTWDLVFALCLYWGTLIYPVVYVVCLILVVIMRVKEKEEAIFIFSVMPLFYLIVIIGIPLTLAWMAGEGKH